MANRDDMEKSKFVLVDGEVAVDGVLGFTLDPSDVNGPTIDDLENDKFTSENKIRIVT